MAKSGSGFVFSRFVWDRDGYNALKVAPEVRKQVERRAAAVARAASDMSGHTYSYNVEVARNPGFGVVAFAAPRSKAAEKDNADNNTLLKSIDAGRL